MARIEKNILLCLCLLTAIAFFGPTAYHKAYPFFYGVEKKWAAAKIERTCKNFKLSETVYSQVYYEDGDEEEASFIQRTVDSYAPLLREDFAIDEDMKCKVVVYPSEALLKRAIGVHSAPMGAYYGGIVNILRPGLWTTGGDSQAMEEFISYGPIVHELSHFFLDVKTKGNFETWFSEGLALYYEKKYTGASFREDLAQKAADIPYAVLRKDFERLNKAAAYRRAYELVNKIAAAGGEEGLLKIYDALSRSSRP